MSKNVSPAAAKSSSFSSNSREFRHMTDAEYQKHRAAGTCYRCRQKFSSTHRCPPKTLNVLIGDDPDNSFEESPLLETSALGAAGAESTDDIYRSYFPP